MFRRYIRLRHNFHNRHTDEDGFTVETCLWKLLKKSYYFWKLKIIYFNCGERYEFMVDHLSYTHTTYRCSATFNLYGDITNSQSDQLPDGLIAQWVKHCTGIAEVMGSNPVQAWIFLRL